MLQTLYGIIALFWFTIKYRYIATKTTRNEMLKHACFHLVYFSSIKFILKPVMFCAFLCYFYGRLFLILFLFRHCVGEQHVSQIARHIFGTDPLGKKRDSSEPGPDLPPHTVECDVEKKRKFMWEYAFKGNICENT